MLKAKDRFLAFKNRLFSTGDGAPLSFLSLVVIVALDILILTTIYSGLSVHTRQIVSPQQYVYGECRHIYLNHTWASNNRMLQLQSVVLADPTRTYYNFDIGRYDQLRVERAHIGCQELFHQLKQLSDEKALRDAFIKRRDLLKLKSKLTSDFQRTKSAYDTSLLEKIADQKESSVNQDETSTVAKQYIQQLQKINQELNAVDNNINEFELVANFWQSIDSNSSKSLQIEHDYRRFTFWYPVKELFWKLVFLVPLFLLFYFWFTRSVKKKSTIQTLVASHLLVVASIPTVIEIADTVLDLIPKQLLVKLFNLLESLHLVAIWYYLVILAAIGAAFAAIAIIQKTLFSKERVYQKRLMKGECCSCAKKLPEKSDKICPFCGANQFEECHSCGKETYVNATYCIHCGDKALAP